MVIVWPSDNNYSYIILNLIYIIYFYYIISYFVIWLFFHLYARFESSA